MTPSHLYTKGCGWGDRTKENTINSNAEPHKHSIFEFQLLRQKKRVGIKSFCSQVTFLPIMIVRSQDHTWTGVGIACDPGTVDCKHHQQHQHQHGDNAFYIRT